jgi:hypothetical protein
MIASTGALSHRPFRELGLLRVVGLTRLPTPLQQCDGARIALPGRLLYPTEAARFVRRRVAIKKEIP